MRCLRIVCVAAVFFLFAVPAGAQVCASMSECARLVESLASGDVRLNEKNARQTFKLNGCEFERRYSQMAQNCQGQTFGFEQTDTGTIAALTSAFVQTHNNNTISLLFSNGSVRTHRYCEECRVKERTAQGINMMLAAVNPGEARRLADALSTMARLCGASGVNKPDPVTHVETGTARPAPRPAAEPAPQAQPETVPSAPKEPAPIPQGEIIN